MLPVIGACACIHAYITVILIVGVTSCDADGGDDAYLSASFGSHLEGAIGESEEEGYLAPVMAVRGQTLNLTLTLILTLILTLTL